MTHHPENLVLTGFMGTGKTTIGEILAKKLGRQFIDTDHIITERLNKSVPEIFEAYGEPFFRAIEASICAELAPPQNLVISTGGGTLVNFENLKTIARHNSIVFCLTADPDEILHRLVNDTRKRPLVDNREDRRAAIANLLASRKQAYARIRMQVQTTGREPEAVAQEIYERFLREVELNEMRSPVWSPTNRYTILTQNGLLQNIGEWLDAYNLEGRKVVVTNETIAPLYRGVLQQALPDTPIITVPDGETYKSLATVETLFAAFAEHGLDRNGIVIALGGGVVGDTAGYAAAAYMRGIRLVQVPTTLLSMVDSSVGGKVGVDIPAGKNLVGAFKQPELVIIDPDVLQTLPDVEKRCGLAEAIKHGFIKDPGILEQTDALMAGDAAAIRRAIQVKIDVVERDPYEDGERAYLNFGHTFAHAIERVSGYTWRHGEAVGLGMAAAAKLSAKLGTLGADKAAQVHDLIESAGLPVRLNGYAPDDIWQAMQTDKKWRDGRSYFVILEDIGKANHVRDVPRETVIDVLEQLRG